MNQHLLTPVHTEAARSVRVACVVCGETASYEQARKNGWTYDLDGRSFEDFYCTKCKGEGGVGGASAGLWRE